MYLDFNDKVSVETSATLNNFMNSVFIWNDRPNLINKRLIGIEAITKFHLFENNLIDGIIGCLFKFIGEVDELTADNIGEYLQSTYKDSINFALESSEQGVCFCVKKLIPKTLISEKLPVIEISIFDHKNGYATFFGFECTIKNDHSYSSKMKMPSSCYRLRYKPQQENNKACIILSLLQEEITSIDNYGFTNSTDDNTNFKNANDWLINKLLPKIVKWSEQDDKCSKKNVVCQIGSLRLIDVNEYCALYQKLKNVYGKKFVKIWPECTDPLKFVYEDVAIASYLLLLWRGKKQNFIDMGCGNGLLVHILTCEGHTGVGYDVRSRKIWSLYPEGTAKLEVKTISPTSDGCSYPGVDWLIGNHSDELTPWIPVMASLSSYRCNFFLLPCCSYELNGQKYQRQNSSKSQYMDYLEHIGNLCRFCGFNYEFDKLRIPSTKRICIVSSKRNYNVNEREERVKSVRDLIKDKCSSNVEVIGDKTDTQDTVAFDKFKTRSGEIKPRNCTQLDKNFVCELVLLISKKILNSTSNKNEPKMNKVSWNEGKPISLRELANSIQSDYLKKLKKECGGLQTLIKNHHFIFKIDKGFISFRKPIKFSNVNIDIKKSNCSVNFKRRPCWFYDNHPDGCPLTNDDCRYIHS